MKLEALRQRLLHAARSAPVPDHAPVGFEARVLRHVMARRPEPAAAIVARAWMDGLLRASAWAGGVAACALLFHVLAPQTRPVALDSNHEPDLLGEALLADMPGLSDDFFPEEPTP